MKNASTAKKAFLYVVVFGLLALVCVYMFVYQKFQEKTTALENQNRVLNERVETLKGYYDDFEVYVAGMESMNDDMTAWLDQFPADVKEDDAIALALAGLTNSRVEYQTIALQDKEELVVVPADITSKASLEGVDGDLTFESKDVSYSLEVDYNNLKKLVYTLNESKGRKVIQDLYLAYDKEQRELAGVIEMYFYSVDGTGKEYVAPVFADYEAGLNELFRCYTEEERVRNILEKYGYEVPDDFFDDADTMDTTGAAVEDI